MLDAQRGSKVLYDFSFGIVEHHLGEHGGSVVA